MKGTLSRKNVCTLGEDRVNDVCNNKSTQSIVDALRQAILTQFPHACHVDFPHGVYLTDSYIRKILQLRGFDSAQQKIINILKCREGFDPSRLKPTCHNELVQSKVLEWRGYTKHGRPILCVDPHRRDRYFDLDKEVYMHCQFIDLGIVQRMRPGTHEFVLVANTEEFGLRDAANVTLVNLLLEMGKLLQKMYPERLHAFYVHPTNSAVKMAFKVVKPLLPAKIVSKVYLMKRAELDLQQLDRDEVSDCAIKKSETA